VILIRYLILLCCCGGLAMADLNAVKSITSLEKRSERALENGGDALDAAKTAYEAGNLAAMRASLKEVQESVELAIQSLRETGKHPSKNTKYYKRGELKTRQLHRRLESFSNLVGLDDRPVVDAVARRVQEIHEEFLNGVMSRKKKS
jgi:exonuclease VII small subunit